jgi:hypothetical protein
MTRSSVNSTSSSLIFLRVMPSRMVYRLMVDGWMPTPRCAAMRSLLMVGSCRRSARPPLASGPEIMSLDVRCARVAVFSWIICFFQRYSVWCEMPMCLHTYAYVCVVPEHVWTSGGGGGVGELPRVHPWRSVRHVHPGHTVRYWKPFVLSWPRAYLRKGD